jgi:hypothetical protein
LQRRPKAIETYCRALIRVVDDAAWPPPLAERHVQGVEHDLGAEVDAHRPSAVRRPPIHPTGTAARRPRRADGAPGEGVEHDREIEKAGPRPRVCR